jgi:hypothetical protein
MDDKDLKINTLEVMMEQNAKEHGDIKDTLIKIEDKIDGLSGKFAGKWVEIALKFLIGSAMVVFIGLLVRWLVMLELG